jgi:hypothetical protein
LPIKAIRTGTPVNLDTLALAELPDAGEPGPGEIRVRLAASSLNYHDYAVVAGRIPVQQGRIPMSDGAGTVEAVGDGVTAFKPGDLALSLFFPEWVDGPPAAERPSPRARGQHRWLRPRERGRTRELVHPRAVRLLGRRGRDADVRRAHRVAGAVRR